MEVQVAGFRAVILDMDGVILDSIPVYHFAWRQAAEEQGFQIADEMFEHKFPGRRAADCLNLLSDELGENFDADAFDKRWRACWEQRVHTHGIPLKDGFRPFLALLDELSIPRAIATSATRAYAGKGLAAHGIVESFQALVCADEVERGKPFPDLFLEATHRLKTSPESCLVVEDSFSGIQAAVSAKMSALWLASCPLMPEIARILDGSVHRFPGWQEAHCWAARELRPLAVPIA